MKFIIKLIVLLIILFNLFLLGLFIYPTPKLLGSLKPTDTVKIYDRNNKLLYEVLDEETGRKSFIAFENVPDNLKNAFIAIEDKRFYEHSGVDLAAIMRAVWQNISAGEIVSGGSTITQQVVRNIIGINKKRTIPQKIKESVLALKVSKFLDKEEVFEIYMNSVYFGGLAYGVESASWQYFDKSVMNLDLAESAFLAGLPQAPNRYNPFKNFSAAKKRQEEVLSAMLKNSDITNTEYNQAVDEKIGIRKSSHIAKNAPHFVDYVLRNSKSGFEKEIITTLDLGMQGRVENILASDVTFLGKFNIENAAAVVLDVKNGDILAMVGSADYSDESIDGEVNVTTSLRQPGSSIKPLIYSLALESGWSVDTIIADEPVSFVTEDGFSYSPKNYDLIYHGNVTLAEALAQSLNVPAVKTLDFVGLASFLNKAKEFGITTFNKSPSHYGLSLALGSGEVKLLELANAYSTFANGGKRADVQFMKSNPEGAIGQARLRGADVISPETANTISAILSSNELRMPAFGEENPLKFSFPVAAKTGTTRNFRDNWTIGFTDDYVVGVWVGNSSGDTMEGVSGISGAGPIFYKIMNMLHESTGTVLTAGRDVKLPIASPSPESEDSYPHFRDAGDGITDFRIISPFANDLYLFDLSKPTGYQKIRLQASESAKWYVDGQLVGEGEEVLWELERGQHEIKAVGDEKERMVRIDVK